MVTESKFTPKSQLGDVAERALHLAAHNMKERAETNPFEALRAAIDEVMCDTTGQKTIWEAGESDRCEKVREFNEWFLDRHLELRRKVAEKERHCNDLLPFVQLGNNPVTIREYEYSAAQFFSLRAEFNLFDDYYFSAVSGEIDFALDMKSPAVKQLWAMFLQANWNDEVKN